MPFQNEHQPMHMIDTAWRNIGPANYKGSGTTVSNRNNDPLLCFLIFFFLNVKFWQTSSQEHKNLLPVPGHRWRQRILLRSSHTPAPRLTSRSQQYWVPSRRVTLHWAVLLFLGAFREAFSAFSSLVCTSFVSLFAASSITSASCVSFTFSPSLSCLPSSTGCWGGKKKLSSW